MKVQIALFPLDGRAKYNLATNRPNMFKQEQMNIRQLASSRIGHQGQMSLAHRAAKSYHSRLQSFITARRYASAAYAVVCLSVRLSHAGIVSKRLNVKPRKQRHMIAQRL